MRLSEVGGCLLGFSLTVTVLNQSWAISSSNVLEIETLIAYLKASNPSLSPLGLPRLSSSLTLALPRHFHSSPVST